MGETLDLISVIQKARAEQNQEGWQGREARNLNFNMCAVSCKISDFTDTRTPCNLVEILNAVLKIYFAPLLITLQTTVDSLRTNILSFSQVGYQWTPFAYTILITRPDVRQEAGTPIQGLHSRLSSPTHNLCILEGMSCLLLTSLFLNEIVKLGYLWFIRSVVVSDVRFWGNTVVDTVGVHPIPLEPCTASVPPPPCIGGPCVVSGNLHLLPLGQ